ncbi:hypothetical protein QBC37DRAFT_294742 [Rhypophila decipiens]|uniref:Uncharacterized protein n=1 Tax=Rhypophila decipiens TaxID=261697 RepID=A0AAN7B5Z7_9PEZI|nr:hypothetical protein QBC37DRAFT_294742 [Rhypophila decipiens]
MRQFNRGAYSSFKAVEKLLEIFHLSHEDLLHDPRRLLDFRATDVHDIFCEPWRTTWDAGVGRDSEFTIAVTISLTKDHPDLFDWRYYDLGKHRIARCIRTGVVIDSEGPPAIITIAYRERSLISVDKYDVLVHEPPVEGQPREIFAISPEAALGKSIEEVAKRAILICAFK